VYTVAETRALADFCRTNGLLLHMDGARLANAAAHLEAGLAALTTLLAARYFVKRIGGYTGDCLGATQQGAELAIYLGILAVSWNFS
jgi:cobalamin synthase